MKTKTAFLIVLFFSFIIINAQPYGKLFSSQEADILFGKVNKSIEMEVKELKLLVEQTQNVFMFRIKDDKLQILGDNRKAIYPGSLQVESNEVFSLFSKSKIIELINRDNSTKINFEARMSCNSITLGEHTLELMEASEKFS